MAFLLCFLNPIKSLRYFHEYLEVVTLLSQYKYGIGYFQPRVIIRRIRLAYLLILVKSIHSGYLYFTPKSSGKLWIILNVDIGRIFRMNPSANLVLTMIILMFAYIGHMYYEECNPALICMVKQIFKPAKPPDSFFLPPYQYKTRNARKLVQNLAVRLINLLQSVIFIVRKWSYKQIVIG